MSEAYLSEIRLFGFNFVPTGWLACDGQLLPIAQYSALYALLGTTYGGDGRTNFALPDLRSRVPIHTGPQTLGSTGGTEGHTLTVAEMPQHHHGLPVSSEAGNSNTPVESFVAAAENGQSFMTSAAATQTMASDCIASAGAAHAHNNMQPFLCFTFCICTQGIFPVRD